MRGDKQDNMVESPDFADPRLGIPVFSLYGTVRRPTAAMMDTFDVLLVDLQDVGTRIYTFVTTLRYVLEEAAARGKAVWVLDRPNPIGRPIEGPFLRPGWESFVGAGPLPMRHGLTLGELARWFVRRGQLSLECEVVAMQGWAPAAAPGWGWPLGERAWVNPSPNAATLSMARAFPGTVMLEGTTLSEGRGTTRPLELFGAPDLDADALLARMTAIAPAWLAGCRLRPCWFEPTFHKHVGQLCAGLQIHVDDPSYEHAASAPGASSPSPSRPCARCAPTTRCGATSPTSTRRAGWRSTSSTAAPRCANGWMTRRAGPGDLDALAAPDEAAWSAEREDVLLYP